MNQSVRWKNTKGTGRICSDVWKDDWAETDVEAGAHLPSSGSAGGLLEGSGRSAEGRQAHLGRVKEGRRNPGLHQLKEGAA